MNLKFLTFFSIISIVFLSGCTNSANDINYDRIDNRIVYTTISNADVESLKSHCDGQGGFFRECGSTGLPIAVCAFTCELEYVVCGCGCCGGVEPVEADQCVNNLSEIIEEDRKAARSPECPNVGCTFGIKYVVCS